MASLGGGEYDLEISDGAEEEEDDPRDAADDTPIVRFNKVLLDAVKQGASDIHFEPYERDYQCAFEPTGLHDREAAAQLHPIGCPLEGDVPNGHL